jgi:hypothetical protein
MTFNRGTLGFKYFDTPVKVPPVPIQ